MTIDEFERIAAETQAAHPSWFDLPGDTPTDMASLEELEAELGAALPGDYRWFLGKHGGGDFAFTRIYSGDSASDLYLLAHQPDRDDFIAFGDDGTGLLFGFPVREGACVDDVMQLDHLSPELVPSRFEGFLDFLVVDGFRLTSQ